MAKRQRASYLSLFLVLAFAAPTTAFADEKPTPTEAKPNAEDLTNQAYDLYKKGEYAKALSLYQRAYQISAATPILFNIANVYDRKLHERDLASEYYRRYLRAHDADPDLVKRANDRLAALKLEEEALRRNTPPPAVAPAPQAAPSDAPPPPVATTGDTSKKLSTMQISGLALAGVGVVGVAVGTIFGLTAKSRNNDAAKLCAGNACTNQEAVTLTDDARSAATTSTVSFILGGALLGGGAVLFLLAPSEGASGSRRAAVPAIRVTPAISPYMAGLTIGGGFQ